MVPIVQIRHHLRYTLPSPLSRHQQLLHPPGKGRQASDLSLFDYCSFIAPTGFGVFAHPGFGGFAHQVTRG
jgi:hypothetical protein